MERINKSFHVEFEILRLKNDREELHANFQKEPGYELKSGTYIILKKEYLRRNSFDDLKLYEIKEQIMLYYAKLFHISQKLTIHEQNNFEFFLEDFRYRIPGWSAQYDWGEIGESKVHFGSEGPYKIEEELQNRGLGSYMLDTLIVWAKENYGSARAKISIGFSNVKENELLKEFIKLMRNKP